MIRNYLAMGSLFMGCSCGRVIHVYRFAPGTTKQERKVVTAAVDEVNNHLGCTAVRIDDNAQAVIAFRPKAELLADSLGEFDQHTGDISIASGMDDDAAVTWITVHEIGHGLGTGHSPDKSDVMYRIIANIPIREPAWANFVEQVRSIGEPCGSAR